MKNFDEMLPQDREFQARGETFHWHDVRPEVLTSFEPSANGAADDENAVWRIVDEQILLFVVADEHDAWRALRARDEQPVTIAQINAILTWLLEEQTGRPTVTPSPSAPGRGRTATSSKAESS